MGQTDCVCDKMTPEINTYSGGFKAPTVNPINFDNIFENFSELLASAPTVFSTLCCILLVYVLLGIWTRRADKKDIEKVGVGVMSV